MCVFFFFSLHSSKCVNRMCSSILFALFRLYLFAPDNDILGKPTHRMAFHLIFQVYLKQVILTEITWENRTKSINVRIKCGCICVILNIRLFSRHSEWITCESKSNSTLKNCMEYIIHDVQQDVWSSYISISIFQIAPFKDTLLSNDSIEKKKIVFCSKFIEIELCQKLSTVKWSD